MPKEIHSTCCDVRAGEDAQLADRCPFCKELTTFEEVDND